MATRKTLREEIQLLYNNQLDKNAFNDTVDVRQIDLLIEKAVNRNLKVEATENIKDGTIDVSKYNLVTYTVATSDSNSISSGTLPVIPIALPRDMGVWRVSSTQGIPTPFIPISMSMIDTYGGTNLEYLEGLIGYWINGKTINFTEASIGTVYVTMFVYDLSQIGEDDLLPIDAGLQDIIVKEVLQLLGNPQRELNSKDVTDAN